MKNKVLSEGEEPLLTEVQWPIEWANSQPEATVLATGLELYVVHAARADDSWAVLSFIRPECVRFGSPNMSELDTHPLFSRSTQLGTLYTVRESSWLREVKSWNQEHPGYSQEHWDQVKHYIAFLWDHTFECLASGISSEVVCGEYHEILQRVTSKLRFVRGVSGR